jgi:hypothetical protein
MFEQVKVAKYVLAHQNELDAIMREVFNHWNKVGKMDSKEEVSNKMQQIFLIGVIRVWLTTSGMPKDVQKQVLLSLSESL